MKDSEIRERLVKLDGWVLHKGRIEKTYEFANFARAAVFFNKLVNPVEEHQHYPIITIAYNRVTVSLFTNEAGRLTEKDFLIAGECEALVA